MVEFLAAMRSGPELRSVLGMSMLAIANLPAWAEWKSSLFVRVGCSGAETWAMLLASCMAPCSMEIRARGEESSTVTSMLKWCIHIENIPSSGPCNDTC